MSTTVKRPRRTQEERSAGTRAALLDAALECLVEYGYAGRPRSGSASAPASRAARTCTTSARAPRSSPPRWRSSRCAASTRSAARSRACRAGDERIEQALDAIWGWFTGPLFQASVDLAAAARTDEELRASLAPVEGRLSQGTLLCCREMLAAGAEDRGRDPLIQMTLGTVRGLALLPILQPGSRSAAKQWAFARERLAGLFRA